MPALDPRVQLTLIHGDAALLIEREARALIDAILPAQDQAYGLTTAHLDVTPVTDALADLYTGSLMAGTRVLWLRNLEALPAGIRKPKESDGTEEPPEPEESADTKGPAKSKQSQKHLVEALKSLPPQVFVVLTHVYVRYAERKQNALSKALLDLVKKSGQIAQFTTPWERDLARWAADETQRMGKRLDPQAAQLLVELTGRDYAALAGEVAKLATYVGEADRITAQDVSRAAVRTAEATSFELVDAIAEGNAAKALEALPDLLPAHNPTGAALMALGMISRNLRLLWQASHLGRNRAPVDRGKPPESLADQLPTQQNVMEAIRSPRQAEKLARHARNFTDAQAAFSLERVLHADRALKGQTDEHLDPRLVVERLVTELCLAAQRSRSEGERR